MVQFLYIIWKNSDTMKNKLFLSLAALTLTSVIHSQTLVEVNEYSRTKTNVSNSNTFTGYFNITDIGVLIGSSDNARVAPFSFMTINGMHITEQLSLGLGVGLEFPTGSYMPLVLDTRYYLRNESFSPFFSLYGGFALPLDDNGYYNYNYWYDAPFPYEDYGVYTAKGSWLINPGFGFRHMFGQNFGVIFGVGYRFQRLHYQGPEDREVYMDVNRLSLKLGITFR